MKSEEKKDLPTGWFSEADVYTYRDLVSSIPVGGKMLELGSWQGKSLCSVADLLKEKDIKVWSVDTFKGTVGEEEAHAEAREKDIKKVCEDNLKHFEISDRVTVIQSLTDDAVGKFENEFFDLIFIDADHSTEAVFKDITNYRPKLKKGGILSGHDWAWVTVRDAMWKAGIGNPVSVGNMWYVGSLKRSGKYSICMIGKNEEKVLSRALASLKGFKDKGGEVCFLDTGSTDNTVKIAKDFGCVVEEVGPKFIFTITKEQANSINETFIVEGEEVVVKEGDKLFNFADARNYCADHLATNDMISCMDCDEQFTKLDLDKIEDLIAQGTDQFEYNFVFAHDEYGVEALKFIQSKFYNKKKLKWAGIIHEVLSPVGNFQVNRILLDEQIIKLEHWQNHETPRGGYLRGLALDCWMHQEADRQSHYFARDLLWNGRYKSAEKEFKRHLTISWWKQERSQSMIFLADCRFKLGDESGGIEWLHKAFQEDGTRREPLMKLAEYYFWKKDWLKTVCYCMAALEIPISGYYSTHKPYYTNMPHELLAECKWYLGDKESSKYHYEKALEHMPLSGKLLHDYRFHNWLPKISILLPFLGRLDGTKRVLESIEKLNYPKELLEVLQVEDVPRIGVPKRVEELFKKSTGEYCVYAANDMEFAPDCLMLAFLDMQKEKKGLCSFNSGPLLQDNGNINEHFMIKRELVEKIGGQIFDTRYFHLGVDNYLWAKCAKINEAMRSERAVIVHNHFTKGAEFDEVYSVAWSKENVDHDRKLLKEDLAKL